MMSFWKLSIVLLLVILAEIKQLEEESKMGGGGESPMTWRLDIFNPLLLPSLGSKIATIICYLLDCCFQVFKILYIYCLIVIHTVTL